MTRRLRLCDAGHEQVLEGVQGCAQQLSNPLFGSPPVGTVPCTITCRPTGCCLMPFDAMNSKTPCSYHAK